MKILRSWKLIVTGLLGAAFALFVLQNREVLELRFLGWEFQARRAYMLLSVFAGGFVSGWILATVTQLRLRGSEDAARRAHGEVPSDHAQ